MRTRAIALATERSNVVGAVELECTPQGLVIVYLGAGAFSEGYAPGALTEGTRVVAPWSSVREAELSSDQLFLHVDSAVTPLNRLVLSHFSSGDAPHPLELRRQRLLLRVGLVSVFVVLVFTAAITLPRFAPRASAAAVLVVGCTAAVGLFAFGLLAEHRLSHGGIDADSTRAQFVAGLSLYVPSLGVTAAPRKTQTASLSVPSLQKLLPRSTAAIAITLSSALLGAILTSNWVLRERPEPKKAQQRVADEEAAKTQVTPPEEAQRPVLAPIASAGTVPTAGPAVSTGAPCSCRRPASVLWESPIPRLSTLVIEKRERFHKDHQHLEVELGVVNNGEQDIRELSLLVQFYERDPPPSSKRQSTQDRPLYFEGPLVPGQAIKWHVEARGTEFEVIHAIDGELDPSGDNAAPTNRFAELLNANHRPVRLHGAMMLVYLGDARARAGILALRDALREDEAPYLDRLLHATEDVFTCNLTVEGTGKQRTVRACVYNRSAEAKPSLGLNVRALDRGFDHRRPVAPPPLVIAEAKYDIGSPLPPKNGIAMRVDFDTDNPDGIAPKTFEAFAGTDF